MNGWKLVPVEPTDDMLMAFDENCDGLDPEVAQSQWQKILAACPVPPAGDVEVLGWLYDDGTVLTHYQAPEVAEHIKDHNFNGGVDKVIKLSDHRAYVTRLQAENAGCQKSLGELWKQIDAYRKSLEKMEAERDALKAEVERMTNLHAAIQLQRDHHRAKADALQSELTKARGLFREVLGVRHDDCLVGRIEEFLAHQSAPAAKDEE